MKYIVCVDNDFGISFGGRRLSRDKRIVEDIIKMTEEGGLSVSPYTASLFPYDKMTVCGSFDIIPDEYVFSELDVPNITDKTDGVVVYCFNRDYPHDVKFEFSPEKLGFTLTEQTEFVGTSHPRITKTVYTR